MFQIKATVKQDHKLDRRQEGKLEARVFQFIEQEKEKSSELKVLGSGT